MASVYLLNYELVENDGSAIPAASVDALVVAYEPSNGAQQDKTVDIVAQPTYPRNITLTVTDANASMTYGEIELEGLDILGRSLSETINIAPVGGSATYAGAKCFARVTSILSLFFNVTGGADTVSLGYGNILALPGDIASANDMNLAGHVSGAKLYRQDANIGVGTISAANSSWALTGGNVPDNVRRFFVGGKFKIV
jgi:hypothetical protein